MQFIATLVFVAAVGADPLSVSGTVTDQAGAPIPGARVFLEPGLALRLVEGELSEDGAFSFTGLHPGLVGVVAIADGRAFGGASVDVGVDEAVTGVNIRLDSPASIAGEVLDPRGHAIPNAQLAGILLQGDKPVGIPLSKLSEFGFESPRTDESGKFSFNAAPSGTLALKFAHPEFAQETVRDIPSGSGDVNVTMYPGVLVQGVVRARGSQLAVARAALIVAGPGTENSTAVAVTDSRGQFAIKLKPGRYACQASSAQFRSPGWESMNVTGRQIVQDVVLYVTGSGSVRGRVRDARSGDPIENVRLALDAFENTVDMTRSGANGGFSLRASEGSNVVRVVEAPGYRIDGILTTKVIVQQGQSVELPDIWLAPIPPISLQVIDESGAGVEGAVVTMLRPSQNRWRQTGANGMLSLDVVNLPSTGRIVGMVEHPTANQGAVFALDVTAGETGLVQLFPLASVRGSVHGSNGKAIEGATVGCAFQEDDASDPILLWRTVSRGDGAFTWSSVVPHLAFVCVVSDGEEGYAYSMPFNLQPGSARDIGRIVLETRKKDESLHQESVNWSRFQHVAGPALPVGFRGPAVLAFADSNDAAVVVDALETAQRILDDDRVRTIAVMTGGASVSDSNVPVLTGLAPSAARTYVLDAAGNIVLETFGLPPYTALRRLASGASFE